MAAQQPSEMLPRVPTPYHDEKGVSKGWNEVTTNGWTFKGTTRPPVGLTEKRALQATLDAERLPSVVHLASELTAEHADLGISLQFNARGALEAGVGSGGGASRGPMAGIYRGNILIDKEKFRARLARNRLIEAPYFGKAVVQDSPRIPVKLLAQQGKMSFYDSIPLYKDDLQGNGSMVLEVKARAMDSFFLVLLREFTHIQSTQVRLVDTRYFYAFGEKVIVRDTEIRESTVENLKRISLETRPSSASLNTSVHADERFFTDPNQVYDMLRPNVSVNEIIPVTIDLNLL